MGKDPVGAIIDVYKRTDNISLSRLAVIQALLSYGIITHAQYMSFIYMKNEMMTIKSRSQQGSVKAEVGSEHCNSDGHITDNEEAGETVDRERNKNSEIQVLKDCLLRQGKESLIPWLQSVLLDACRVKMYPGSLVPDDSVYPHEPVPFYYHKAKQSIPLVPWNRIQYLGLQTEAFILLLHKLGFHLPTDVGKVFPRIPHFWSADHIYSIAQKIGPIDTKKLRFSLEELERISAVASPSLNEEPAMPVRRPSTQKSLSDNEDFDNMEEMYLLEDATRPTPTTTSYVDLAAASKAMRSPK